MKRKRDGTRLLRLSARRENNKYFLVPLSPNWNSPFLPILPKDIAN